MELRLGWGVGLSLWLAGCATMVGDIDTDKGLDEGSFGRPAADVNVYFPRRYNDAREQFKRSAQAIGDAIGLDGVRLDAISVPGTKEEDADLTIDYVHIPAQRDKRNLLVVTSGMHGVEAFVGSALQELMMREVFPANPGLFDNMGALMIHTVNPWGCRHVRRVTENNVDLNRNWDTSSSLFDTKNESYEQIQSFLNPDDPVSWEDSWIPFWTSLAPRSLFQPLRSATTGQYRFERGIYFGGHGFEPQKAPMEALLSTVMAEYDNVFVMDLHTGYGRRGVLHYLGAPNLGDAPASAQVFQGYHVEDGADDESYFPTHGDFIIYMDKLSKDLEKTYIGITMEYGTLDSHTDIGAAKSLFRVRRENQGHHYGFAAEQYRTAVLSEFRSMFDPPDIEWRKQIMQTTRNDFPELLERFSTL